MHILPDKFHRIRHYGILANAVRAQKLVQVREALQVPIPGTDIEEESEGHSFSCRRCGTPLLIIEIIRNLIEQARAPPSSIALSA